MPDHAGLRAIKGASRTFDLAGFIAKLREPGAAGHAGRFPVFDRHTDCIVPDAGRVSADAAIILVEGKYLLLTKALLVRAARCHRCQRPAASEGCSAG
ncbi:MAG: hypothetical protein JJU09_01430 [Rhodobacteraceae bacterium]|nr:hypothetical protein [Paracoccaceae bacterium]